MKGWYKEHKEKGSSNENAMRISCIVPFLISSSPCTCKRALAANQTKWIKVAVEHWALRIDS